MTTADTAWTEADYYTGFRRTALPRRPWLKLSLITAVAAVNACAVLVALRVGSLPEFDFAQARGDRAIPVIQPSRPTLLAVAGAPAAYSAVTASLPATSGWRMAATETGTEAYALAMAAGDDGMTVDETAVNDVAVNDAAPDPVIDDAHAPDDGSLPDRPVPYLLLADAEPADQPVE